MNDLERTALAMAGRADYPATGDARKKYDVVLTEPEINAIHAAIGFFRGAHTSFPRWWENYGPALEGLSKKLEAFDDGDAPYQGN